MTAGYFYWTGSSFIFGADPWPHNQIVLDSWHKCVKGDGDGTHLGWFWLLLDRDTNTYLGLVQPMVFGTIQAAIAFAVPEPRPALANERLARLLEIKRARPVNRTLLPVRFAVLPKENGDTQLYPEIEFDRNPAYKLP